MYNNLIESQLISTRSSTLDDEIFSSHLILTFNNILLSVDNRTLDKIAEGIICQNSTGSWSVSNMESNLFEKSSASWTF